MFVWRGAIPIYYAAWRNRTLAIIEEKGLENMHKKGCYGIRFERAE